MLGFAYGYTIGLPYFKFLKNQHGDGVEKSDFARLQREALEEYLIKLIRAVVCGLTVFKSSIYLMNDNYRCSTALLIASRAFWKLVRFP